MADNSDLVSYPRDHICDLVGLPSSCTDAELDAAINAVGSRPNPDEVARKAAAAQQLHAQDKRLVQAAVATGKIGHPEGAQWLAALQRDRAGTTRVLASLSPGLRPDVSYMPPAHLRTTSSESQPWAPVVVGRPPSEWTDQEVQDSLIWKLGARFRTPDMKPPPTYGVYMPPFPGSASDDQNNSRRGI